MQPFRGILLKIASVVVFLAMASCIKATGGDIPAGELVFFRSVFAIPVIVAWLVWTRELRTGFAAKNPMGHLWRGMVGTTAMGLGFAALLLLPLPEVTVIGYAAPILSVVFAAMFLSEEVRLFRLGAVALGMAGVMIVLAPRLSTLSSGGLDGPAALGAMVALLAAVFAALAQVFVRKLVHSETTSAIVFWFSVTATLLSLVTLPFGWVWPTGREAALLVLAGLLGGLGQILLTSAYRHAIASVVAPFEYTSMILALAVGYFGFGEVPTTAMLGGAALVVGAGVLIIWRERQLGIERGNQRKAMSP